MFSGKIEGIIDFSGLPKAVEQNSKLSGNGNDGSLFSVLASPFGQLQAPTSQIAIGSKRPENVLCGGHQQAAQVGVSGLGDSQLRVMVAGLIPSGDQTDCGSDLPCSGRKRTSVLENVLGHRMSDTIMVLNSYQERQIVISPYPNNVE